MAQLAKESIGIDVPLFNNGVFNRSALDQQDAALKSAQAKAREKSPGDLTGEVLRWQRGDGYALYMVVSEAPLTLAHVAIGDAWTVESALIRGLDISDVRRMVQGEKSMARMFARQQDECAPGL